MLKAIDDIFVGLEPGSGQGILCLVKEVDGSLRQGARTTRYLCTTIRHITDHVRNGFFDLNHLVLIGIVFLGDIQISLVCALLLQAASRFLQRLPLGLFPEIEIAKSMHHLMAENATESDTTLICSQGSSRVNGIDREEHLTNNRIKQSFGCHGLATTTEDLGVETKPDILKTQTLHGLPKGSS